MTADELHRLLIAPEIIVIDVAAATLHALRRALLVEHPTLAGGYDICELAPIEQRTLAVLRSTRHLQRALDAYRATADEIIQTAHGDDDIPF